MLRKRPSEERGRTQHEWLESHHSFSFAGYQDPGQEGFRSLRAINENILSPAQGFGLQRHLNVEIVSYILKGTMQHRDNMGHADSVLETGDLLCVTAGNGATFSQINASKTEPVHFYQLWIASSSDCSKPGRQELKHARIQKHNRLALVASKSGSESALTIDQDANLYLSQLDGGVSIEALIAPNRHAWLQVLTGSVDAGGIELLAGDGLAASDERTIQIVANCDSELLLFDLL